MKILVSGFHTMAIANIASFGWPVLLYLLNNKTLLVTNEFMAVFIIIICIIFLTSYLSVVCLKHLHSKGAKQTFQIVKITPVYREFFPLFLGIVVIALSLKSLNDYGSLLLFVISILLFVFFWLTQIWTLNPAYRIFKVYFYKVETDKSEYILITGTKKYQDLYKQNIQVAKLNDEYLIYWRAKK